jgi:hypothetical protein
VPKNIDEYHRLVERSMVRTLKHVITQLPNRKNQSFHHYNLTELLQWILATKRIYSKLHFGFERTDDVRNELWTCDFWNMMEQNVKQINEQSKMLSLILYLDSALVEDTRNRGVHPLYILLGNLPLEERLKKENRFLYGYIPSIPDKDNNSMQNILLECMNVFGKLLILIRF